MRTIPAHPSGDGSRRSSRLTDRWRCSALAVSPDQVLQLTPKNRVLPQGDRLLTTGGGTDRYLWKGIRYHQHSRIEPTNARAPRAGNKFAHMTRSSLRVTDLQWPGTTPAFPVGEKTFANNQGGRRYLNFQLAKGSENGGVCDYANGAGWLHCSILRSSAISVRDWKGAAGYRWNWKNAAWRHWLEVRGFKPAAIACTKV